jgi:hypothetical protein
MMQWPAKKGGVESVAWCEQLALAALRAHGCSLHASSEGSMWGGGCRQRKDKGGVQ